MRGQLPDTESGSWTASKLRPGGSADGARVARRDGSHRSRVSSPTPLADPVRRPNSEALPQGMRRHPEPARSSFSLIARLDPSHARQLTRFNLAIDFTARWQCFQVIHGLEIQPEFGR